MGGCVMCGFIAAKKDHAGMNKFIQKRGEDFTSDMEINGYRFVHNLLHITGKKTPQPFTDGEVVCVYNGEIYNQPYEKSDGEVLIPLYRKHGPEFVKHLEGEFAIALFDFDKGLAVFSTDIFRSKPIWINQYGASSYKSGLSDRSISLPVNTCIVRDLNTGKDRSFRVHDFDWQNQHKDNYDDWITAFERAVYKRATGKCFIGLSSGYDSGAIDCALRKIEADYKAFSIRGNENDDILLKRNTPMEFTPEDAEAARSYISDNAEDFQYKYFANRGSVKKDSASIGMGHIFTQAKEAGYRIYLSGQGADEIMSDYAMYPGQTELGGVFPKELRPWQNFFHGCQEAYLAKEEYIAGAYSIEGRYPFLDKDVVQEFLWLGVELKNRKYKAPIHEYLTRNGYPFKENEKIGFSALERVLT
jgi:asparagine synthetase B (glutamine-hydrolysing)